MASRLAFRVEPVLCISLPRSRRNGNGRGPRSPTVSMASTIGSSASTAKWASFSWFLHFHLIIEVGFVCSHGLKLFVIWLLFFFLLGLIWTRNWKLIMTLCMEIYSVLIVWTRSFKSLDLIMFFLNEKKSHTRIKFHF